MTSTQEDLRETAIVYVGSEIEEAKFKVVYPEVKLVRASINDYSTKVGPAIFPDLNQFDTSYLQGESVLAFQALQMLEAQVGNLEYVEFADWGGCAYASCQEKKLGRALQDTTLAVRLHTTDSVLASIESRLVDLSSLCLYDLERKALADCDLIVAQLQTVSDAMRDFYDFEETDWNQRAVVSAPPVLLDTLPPATSTTQVTPETPIVFSSKIQHVKRPDVVVQGCTAFLASTPGYRGKVIFLAHAFDRGYLDKLKSHIPEALGDRFTFMGGVDVVTRERTIARSVCVFPSSWESFCLAAYEASLSGALCLLNGENPAFQDGTPWIDGANCIKFDGTSLGLAAALSEIFSEPRSLVPVEFEPIARFPTARKTHAEPLNDINPVPGNCEVVIACKNSGLSLISLLSTLEGMSKRIERIHIVDLGSHERITLRILDEIERRANLPVNVIRGGDASELARLLNDFSNEPGAKYLLITEAGYDISPDFVDDACNALDRHHEFTHVTGHCAQDHGRDLLDGHMSKPPFESVKVVVGEALCSGLYSNKFSASCFMVRRGVLSGTPFESGLVAGMTWKHFGKSVSNGARVLVSSRIEFADVSSKNLLEGASPLADPGRFYHDMVRKEHFKLGKRNLPMFALGKSVQINVNSGLGQSHGTMQGDSIDVSAALRRLDELENSRVVKLALGAAITASSWMPSIAVKAVRSAFRSKS
jgi:hypothetical protein